MATTNNSENNSESVLAVLDAHQGQQRQLCVHLSQRGHIFNDSLRDNLKIARPTASDDELRQVLQTVALGYLDLDQVLGNGGRFLSGGEVRRVGIARVLLSQAKFIVLDEPTESIDAKIEQVVLEQIFSHAKALGATVILVSHNEANRAFCNHQLTLSHLGGKSSLQPLAAK